MPLLVNKIEQFPEKKEINFEILKLKKPYFFLDERIESRIQSFPHLITLIGYDQESNILEKIWWTADHIKKLNIDSSYDEISNLIKELANEKNLKSKFIKLLSGKGIDKERREDLINSFSEDKLNLFSKEEDRKNFIFIFSEIQKAEKTVQKFSKVDEQMN